MTPCRDCDSCGRDTALSYSPRHEAYFCAECFDRENSLTFKKIPKCWGMYRVYDGTCLLGAVSREPVARGGEWRALPASEGRSLGPFKTRGGAAKALIR